LLVSIPPPMGLDGQLAIKLQGWVVRSSGMLLDLLNVAHAISANVIQVPGRRLLVEEACSGINSLIAIVCFTLSFGFWERRGPVRILILIACAIAFVLAANLLRITVGAYLLVKMGIDVFPESIHEIVAIGIFVTTLGLVVSADRLLHFFSGNAKVFDRTDDADDEEAHESLPFELRRHHAFLGKCLALLTVYAMLLSGQITGLWIRGARLPAFFAHSHLTKDATFSLPSSIAGWQQSTSNPNFGATPEMTGREGKAWMFRRGPIRAIVAFDGPFAGFHDLTDCYTSAGWNVTKDNWASSPVSQSGIAHASMKNLNVYGDLLFSLTDEGQGKFLDPGRAINYSAIGRFGRWTAAGNPDPVVSHQIQVLTSSYEPLTDAQRQSVNALFLASRTQLVKQLLDQVDQSK
jgi:exosortase/archaeosortase family protein